MIFELSRDYARAWQLIQQGDRLACEYDRRIHRDVSKCSIGDTSTIAISSQMLVALYLPTALDDFAKRCTELNTEFYLPLADNTIVISEERLTEITSKVIDRNFENLKKYRKGEAS